MRISRPRRPAARRPRPRPGPRPRRAAARPARSRRRSCRRRSGRRSRSRARRRSIVRRVSVHIATGLSTTPDARAGSLEAASAAARGLGERSCDLVVLFASGAHLAAPEATLAAVHEMLAPATLIGCGAGGVISDAREIETGTAVSVWAASLGDGEVLPVPRHRRGARGGLGRALGAARPRGRHRRDPARRPIQLPDRRRPALPLRGDAAAAAARRRGVRAHARQRPRAVLRRGGGRRRRGRRAPRRRRGAAVRLPGRRADRPRADHHGGRRPHHRRAGGQAALSKLREAIDGLSQRTATWSTAGC